MPQDTILRCAGRALYFLSLPVFGFQKFITFPKGVNMRVLVYFALAVALGGFAAAQQTSSPKDKPLVRESMIVSTDWLAKHLNDDSLVLLQVGEKAEFAAAHIPGAQFIQLADISTPRGQGLALELPDVAQLQKTFAELGISDKSRIVVYFSKDWVTPTTRVFFTLDYLGLGDRTAILDGGLPAWREEKRPVTTEEVISRMGHITPRPNKQIVVDAAWVKSNLGKPGVMIVDARAAKYYSGEDPGRMPRAGHIPGAKNISFDSVVEESNKFKSVAALRQLFNTAGAKPGDSVATYCHVGQQASLLYFVARYLGYDSHLYDGSFEDWSQRPELPVEISPGVKGEAKP
jgi:thiosulfate/3-mercaptopyruvate sulfurtransferase